MAKAINWPQKFRDDVIREETDELQCAFRLGSLYFDNHYWSDGEEILIRVNHKVIRKAKVVGDMKKCALKDLDARDLEMHKPGVKTVDEVIQYLAQTYKQEVDPETVITVVYYKNLPIDPEIMEVEDDPHMM